MLCIPSGLALGCWWCPCKPVHVCLGCVPYNQLQVIILKEGLKSFAQFKSQKGYLAGPPFQGPVTMLQTGPLCPITTDGKAKGLWLERHCPPSA